MSRHNMQHGLQKKNWTSVVGKTFRMPSAASQVALMALCPLFILLPLDIRCYTSIFVTVSFICIQSSLVYACIPLLTLLPVRT